MADEKKRGRALIRIAVDAAMAALFVSVMATALVYEAPHEYLGIAVFSAVVVHIVLNRRQFKALFHGRYNIVCALQLVAIAGLLACVIGQIVSSIVLSKFAFGFLPSLPGTTWARRVHMLCSYWGFVFAFIHAGLQFKGFERLVLPKGTGSSTVIVWIARTAFVFIACFGVYSFVQSNFCSYLLGQVQFALVDYSEAIVLAFARYASIAVLIMGMFHCLRWGFEMKEKKKRRIEVS